MKIVWTAILHAVGNPSFFPWPLRMCVCGYVSTGYLCHDSSTEFLIYSPGMFHLFPSPCMPHKRWMVLSFDIPSKELCRGEFLLAISSHEWPTTGNWTSYVPVYKSLVVHPAPGASPWVLHPPGLIRFSPAEPALPASPSHLFPNSSLFLGSWSPRLSILSWDCWELPFLAERLVLFVSFLHHRKETMRKIFSPNASSRNLSFKKLFSWRISQSALENVFLLYTFLPSYNTAEHPTPRPPVPSYIKD